ncbi:MAG: PASTA domain-containing protein [Ruminococcus flavefaciens]|nr:PASTA domain-containing protein [Ruminococcus flavefaciens]MCM1229631.1 PASTA domain-containing protein [Ruminococcus flavefaciens]
MGERRFCYRCMEKYDMEQHICPHCGFDDTTPHNPMYIAPGTLLRDRYMVGIMLSYNGEGATYVGHDISTGCKIMLREYMPANFCTRVKGKATISVNYNNLAKYKAFMAEFTELNKSLAQLRNNSNINPVLDMFADNNTTYAVFEYLDGEKMLDYLKDNAGELSWEQVSKLFPPLFTTIGILHNAGIIHRAISPDTVYINSKGELKLSGFCVSAVRTADAGLEYELFKGYAAPEQYSASSSSRQGSWTDVYSVCALLYRALTGCMPVDSTNRLKNDDLCEPAMLNRSIPAHVSKTIMDGMNLNGSERIQTITELVTRLFEQPVVPKPIAPLEHKTAVTPAVPPENQVYQQYQQQRPEREQRYIQQSPEQQNYERRRQRDDYDEYHYEKVSTVDRLKVPVVITILLLAILIIISVFIMRVFVPAESGDSSSFSRSSSSVPENVVTDDDQSDESVIDTVMPNFVGKFFELTEKKYADYFTFEVEYEYDDDHEADMIIDQDIDEGTQVAQGCTVTLTVSRGKENADIPDYNGLSVSQYENELKKAGVSNYSFIESTSTYGYPDTITQLQVDGKEVKAGEHFSNKKSKLIVYYIPKDAEVNTPQTDYSQWTADTTAETTANNQSYTTTAVAPSTTAPPVVTEPPQTEPPAPVITDPPPTEPPAPVITDPPQTDTPPVEPDPPVDDPNVGEW